ncbi:MAG: hypothetical protein SLAVMIC_00713 [uncultured marine phage]|uniref:Uncharacterized protein n=1 Tax=uncultured marine phage TaxID=707152 RepID=A0A8D9C9D5_9VIRU|nr:MAG: hypothetical protein SLAVMIC_00713 [uncultured marine phage]
MGIFFNKKPDKYQTRYKQVEIWIDEPGYRWVDGENIYVPGYWTDSSTPIDSESDKYEKYIMDHIEHNYLTEGNFEKSKMKLDEWIVDRGFRITDCKESTVEFHKNDDWGK